MCRSLHRLLDRAAVLVRVRAVGEAAQRHKRPKLGEEALHFLGDDVPQLELADARRIDDPAAEVELGSARAVVVVCRPF